MLCNTLCWSYIFLAFRAFRVTTAEAQNGCSEAFDSDHPDSFKAPKPTFATPRSPSSASVPSRPSHTSTPSHSLLQSLHRAEVSTNLASCSRNIQHLFALIKLYGRKKNLADLEKYSSCLLDCV